MAQQTINIGTSPNDGTGDPLRTAGQKINSNFTEVYNTSQSGFNVANTAVSSKVSKAGDTMTGQLNFFTANTAVGNIQDGNGIDIFAKGSAPWAQLNFANTNFVYVNTDGSYMQGANASVNVINSDNIVRITHTSNNWDFYANGTLIFPDGTKQSTAYNVVSQLANTSYIMFLDETGVLRMPLSFYNTSRIYAPGTSDLFIGSETNHWQFRGDGEGLVFPDNTIQKTAFQFDTVPTTSKGQIGDKANSFAANATYLFFCTEDYTDGIADIWKRVSWSNDTW